VPRISSFLLMALLFLAGSAVAQPAATPCKAGVRHVELPTEPTHEIPEVCISPWLATTFSFDTDVLRESITLGGRERFVKVDVGDSMLKLVPSEKLTPGERLRLTLRFKDGAAPANAAFILVVQAVQADTYVEVHRERRTVESCQKELKEKAAELEQCRAENEHLRSTQEGPDGLRGLIATGEVDEDAGILPKRISRSITRRPGNAFTAKDVASYRSKRSVAVEVELQIPAGAAPCRWCEAGGGGLERAERAGSVARRAAGSGRGRLGSRCR
jgi:uncharacterized protein (TIGR02268 family)